MFYACYEAKASSADENFIWSSLSLFLFALIAELA